MFKFFRLAKFICLLDSLCFLPLYLSFPHHLCFMPRVVCCQVCVAMSEFHAVSCFIVKVPVLCAVHLVLLPLVSLGLICPICVPTCSPSLCYLSVYLSPPLFGVRLSVVHVMVPCFRYCCIQAKFHVEGFPPPVYFLVSPV